MPILRLAPACGELGSAVGEGGTDGREETSHREERQNQIQNLGLR